MCGTNTGISKNVWYHSNLKEIQSNNITVTDYGGHSQVVQIKAIKYFQNVISGARINLYFIYKTILLSTPISIFFFLISN